MIVASCSQPQIQEGVWQTNRIGPDGCIVLKSVTTLIFLKGR